MFVIIKRAERRKNTFHFLSDADCQQAWIRCPWALSSFQPLIQQQAVIKFQLIGRGVLKADFIRGEEMKVWHTVTGISPQVGSNSILFWVENSGNCMKTGYRIEKRGKTVICASKLQDLNFYSNIYHDGLFSSQFKWEANSTWRYHHLDKRTRLPFCLIIDFFL